MAVGALALAFVAGVLSILSPCVLSILPIVLGAAASEHRWGPAALAICLAVSFVTVGLFVATVGYSIGLDSELLRNVAAALMISVGVILLVPRFQERLALVGAPLATWSDRHFGASRQGGLSDQILAGLLLEPSCRPHARSGIDSRCAGSRSRRSSGHDVSFRAAIPLAALGLLSREALLRWRTHLISGE
jgi:cytochrome c-type biogenesis protein